MNIEWIWGSRNLCCSMERLEQLKSLCIYIDFTTVTTAQYICWSCSCLPPLLWNMWLDSSKNHSSLFIGLQLQSNSQSVLLVLIYFNPCSRRKHHLLDLMIIHKTSRNICTVPQCWDYIYIYIHTDVLCVNFKIWSFLKCMTFFLFKSHHKTENQKK